MDIMQIVMDSIAIGNTIKSVIVGKNRAAHFRTQYSKKKLKKIPEHEFIEKIFMDNSISCAMYT